MHPDDTTLQWAADQINEALDDAALKIGRLVGLAAKRWVDIDEFIERFDVDITAESAQRCAAVAALGDRVVGEFAPRQALWHLE